MFEKFKAVVISFLASAIGAGGRGSLGIIENPTEEIQDALARGKNPFIYVMKPGFRTTRRRLVDLQDYAPKGSARGEMNYLFSTRRYAAGAITAADLLYFSQAVGGDATSMGFGGVAGFGQLSENETNLDTPNQVPQGKGFIIREEGISFNMEANGDDIEQVLDSGSLSYQTQGGQLVIRRGPLGFWPGGHGVSGYSNLQGTQSTHHGVADPHAVRKLGKYPRIIKPLQNFNYIHKVPRSTRATNGAAWNLSTDVLARVWLWGEQIDKIPE